METDMFMGNPDYYTIEQQKEVGMWPVGFLPSKGMAPYLKRLGTDLVGLEVGVLKGENAFVLLDTLPNIKMLYGLDNYKPHKDYDLVRTEEDMKHYKETAIANIQPYWDRFTFIEEDLADKKLFVEAFKPESMDFILLDADHTYHSVKEQLELYYPVVKKGGYIFINDTHIDAVKDAIMHYREDKKIRIPVHMSANNLMFWQKT
jgi:predicted O-methyltransferase YrrM